MCALVPYALYRIATPRALDAPAAIALHEVTTWSGATAGAAAALALMVCVPRRGLALSTVAGPVAVCTFMLGFVTINVVDAGPKNIKLLAEITTDILGLSFLLVAAIAPLALIPRIFSRGVGWSAVVAATIALIAGTGAVAVTADATPVTEQDLIFGDLAPTTPEGVAAREYLAGTGKDVTDGVLQAFSSFEEMMPQLLTGDPALSQRIRSEIVEPLTVLKADAEGEQPRSEMVAAVHADGVALIDAFITSFGGLADSLAEGDAAMVTLSIDEIDESLALFDRWAQGMDKLSAAAK